jgi:hypothetical protein
MSRCLLHYGFHPGTTGEHFAAALERRAGGTSLPSERGRHVTVALNDCDSYLWIESGIPSYPLDTGTVAVPTAGYLIDVHQHLPTSLLQAALFDLVFVAQRNFVARIRTVNPSACWLPLAAPSEFLDLQREPAFEVGFVGQARPGSDRHRLLSRLSAEFSMNEWWRPHNVAEMADVYRQSRVVVNPPTNRDLNMRFFEAMACGAAVVSPPLRNGAEEIAVAGQHYLVLPLDQPSEVARLLRKILDDGRDYEVGQSGRALVATEHTYDQRLEVILRGLRAAPLAAPIRAMPRRKRAASFARLSAANADAGLAVAAIREQPSVVLTDVAPLARAFGLAARRQLQR